MTRWVAIFEDNPEPDVGWIRKQHAEAHFAYLGDNRHKILLGGGLRHRPGDWYCGGMWVMEVDSREEAASLCENDHSSNSVCARITGCMCGVKRPVIRR